MGKGYFKFKNFTVFQDQCGMKVCTDSCLFGSLIDVEKSSSILDIGAGTGLLSLMMAQRTKANITAIEPNTGAFKQAVSNVANSPFKNITVLNHTLQDYTSQTLSFYELIVCNPPFYSNYLKSADEKYNGATHTQTLPFEELISITKSMLDNKGTFWVLLPPLEFNALVEIAKSSQLHLIKQYTVFDKPNAKPIRNIGVFTHNKTPAIDRVDLYIKDRENNYTDQFKSLLANYYLNF